MAAPLEHYEEQRIGRFTVRWFDSIDSTNRYLLEAADSEDLADGTVAVAAHQTAGRGRRGRVWDDRPGASLLFSTLFRPESGVTLNRYAQVIALAVTDACASAGGFDAQVKWPNDLLVGERKLAGILSETSTTGGRTSSVVVGCGLNLNWEGRLPEGLPNAISADEAAGRLLQKEEVLTAILTAVDAWSADGEAVPSAYRERCATLGRLVRVMRESGDLVGTAVDITDDGALVLDVEGERTEVTVGEAVHLRPA